MRGSRLALLLFVCAIQLYSQAMKRTEGQWEQTNFEAGVAFKNPKAIPGAALDSLRASRNGNDLIQMCAENEGIPIDKIPESWFVASEIGLSSSSDSGLVIRGEHQCLGGAHIAQFWVLAKSATGFDIVFRGRADALRVLPTRTNGYRDLQLIIVTQAGAYVDDVNFRYRNGHYQKAGHHREHSIETE